MARARGECVWAASRNLSLRKRDAAEGTGEYVRPGNKYICAPSQLQKAPNSICHQFILFIQGNLGLARFELRAGGEFVRHGSAKTQRKVYRGRL